MWEERFHIHHHLLDTMFEADTVPDLRQKPLYTTPSGWWWCEDSLFRPLYMSYQIRR